MIFDMAQKEHINIRADEELDGRVEEYRNDMGYEHKTAATEQLLRLGLETAGYGAPMEKTTWLMRITKSVTAGLFVLGFSWVLGGFAFGIDVAVTSGFAASAVAVSMLVLHSALERKEPRVSRKITEMVDPKTDVVATDGGEKE
jgi:hypothetical protein